MKLLKTLALLISLSYLSALTSCSEDGFENFPEDVYNNMETKATEPNDSTGAGQISIHINEPEYEGIDYTVTLP